MDKEKAAALIAAIKPLDLLLGRFALGAIGGWLILLANTGLGNSPFWITTIHRSLEKWIGGLL